MLVTVLIIVANAGKVRAETSVSDGFYDVIVVVTSLRQQRAVSHVGPPPPPPPSHFSRIFYGTRSSTVVHSQRSSLPTVFLLFHSGLVELSENNVSVFAVDKYMLKNFIWLVFGHCLF